MPFLFLNHLNLSHATFLCEPLASQAEELRLSGILPPLSFYVALETHPNTSPHFFFSSNETFKEDARAGVVP